MILNQFQATSDSRLIENINSPLITIKLSQDPITHFMEDYQSNEIDFEDNNRKGFKEPKFQKLKHGRSEENN